MSNNISAYNPTYYVNTKNTPITAGRGRFFSVQHHQPEELDTLPTSLSKNIELFVVDPPHTSLKLSTDELQQKMGTIETDLSQQGLDITSKLRLLVERASLYHNTRQWKDCNRDIAEIFSLLVSNPSTLHGLSTDRLYARKASSCMELKMFDEARNDISNITNEQ